MQYIFGEADSLHATGNAIESSFWFLVGAGFGFAALRRDRLVRGRFMALAIAFVLFGLSDVVEIQTGSWWRPWWLFVWKAVCVLFFAWQYRVYRIERSVRRSSAEPGHPDRIST